MSAASHLRRVPRRPRNPAELRTAINALTAQQKNAIWADLNGGNPPKWSTGTGASVRAMIVLHWAASSITLLPADVNEARLRMAVLWVMDNPNYLVQPAFDRTINVPGDAPIVS